MANIAAYRLNLAPNSPLLDLNGKPVDLSIYCGADWVLQVPFTAADGVTPVNLTTPQMQIRASDAPTSALIIAPTLVAAGNTITITIPGSLTKTLPSQVAAYDLYAVRSDTGVPVKLLTGSVTIVQSTTVLT